jgi:hypothetical protein
MKTSSNLMDKLRRRVRAKGPGAVFGTADFLDLGSRAAVDQALSRLTKEGALRRLRRGVYDYPRVHEALGITLTPPPEEIAKALARGHKSELQVTGAQAANVLGLSEQVPARVVFLTDGATGIVQIGNQTIQLRHASPRNMQTAGKISGTVIQALRHLGKKKVTEEVIARLQSSLSAQEKKLIRQDLLFAPGWMQPILSSITNICEKNTSEGKA